MEGIVFPLQIQFVGTQRFPKNCRSHIDASLSRQPLVKGERLVRYEVNAVMVTTDCACNVSSYSSAKPDYLQIPTHCWQLLAAARKLTTPREILLWMTPSEAPKALQASECSELLDPMRASCWIFAQH